MRDKSPRADSSIDVEKARSTSSSVVPIGESIGEGSDLQ